MCVCVSQTYEEVHLCVCASQQSLYPLLLPPLMTSFPQLQHQQQLHLLMKTLALLMRHTRGLHTHTSTHTLSVTHKASWEQIKNTECFLLVGRRCIDPPAFSAPSFGCLSNLSDQSRICDRAWPSQLCTSAGSDAPEKMKMPANQPDTS